MSAASVEVAVGALRTAHERLPDEGGGALLVTDRNVERLLPAGLARLPRHVIEPGEASKSWDGLGRLLLDLDRQGVDRDGHLVAVGGGVVTDLAGLAASLHRRGIAWTAAPTSLVGQVDAAHGGKTAVDLGGGKNTVGTFHPPRAVIVDPGALSTLPRRHLLAGMGEVLKTALIAGPGLLQAVEALAPDDFARAAPAAVDAIEACIATKTALVGRDPHDRGARLALNLGHTFGHALEAEALPAAPRPAVPPPAGARRGRAPADGDGAGLLHGEAVALGLLCAARLAAARPEGDRGLEARLRATLVRWGLPTAAAVDPERLLAQMGRDKKRAGGALRLVLALAPGRVVVEPAGPEAIRAGLAALDQTSSTS